MKPIFEEYIAPLRPPRGTPVAARVVAHDDCASDSDVFLRAASAANGSKFLELWRGSWQGNYRSQSEADFALIAILALYSGVPQQVARLFRQSTLGQRGKAQREDYVDSMIAKALSQGMPQLKLATVPASLEEPWISAADLRHKHFADSIWVIPNIVPQGATILGGRPKLGKSWAALGWALAVAEGSSTFGTQCEEGDVLYAALEDTLRRLKDRVQKVKGSQAWPERLSFLTELSRADEGGVELVRRWLQQATKPKLVIIDTLAKVRPGKGREEGNYDADYRAVTCWKDLADEFNVAIVLVHHVRKLVAEDPLEMISGTNGLTGAADAILILNRTSQGCTLGGRGRDLEEFELAIRFDSKSCCWSVLGDASDVRRSSERNRILVLLEQSTGALAPKQIAEALNMNDEAVRQMLLRMAAAGEIIRAGRGLYRSTSHDSHSVTLM